jgi:hypothetical protein
MGILNKLFRFPEKEAEPRKPTVYDEEQTKSVLRRARRAEDRFDVEFRYLMQQLDSMTKRED